MKTSRTLLGGVRLGPPARGYLAVFSLLALTAVLYWPAFVWMSRSFAETDSYYRHGWLLMGGIGFLLWLRRGRIFSVPPAPSGAGLIFLLAGAGAFLFGCFTRINFLMGWSLPLTLFGIILFNWGGPRARLFYGPLWLMVFIIPLPGVIVITAAFHLKVLALSVALVLVRWLGIEVWSNGFELIIPAAPLGETLKIGDPCSGLRSLISFGALGGFFACLFPLSPVKKATVLVAALLLAPVSNILRMVSLIVLRRMVGPAILSGPWHIVVGIVVFGVCLVLLLQVIRWLLR